MARQRGAFRSVALSAKERLSGGFWEGEQVRRAQVLEEAETKGVNQESAKEFYRNRLASQISCVDTEAEQFYQRVVEILRESPNANPLSTILDREYMRTLSDGERDRYVFTLSKKVQECVQRFNKEKELL